jgi:hypothetical protein
VAVPARRFNRFAVAREVSNGLQERGSRAVGVVCGRSSGAVGVASRGRWARSEPRTKEKHTVRLRWRYMKRERKRERERETERERERGTREYRERQVKENTKRWPTRFFNFYASCAREGASYRQRARRAHYAPPRTRGCTARRSGRWRRERERDER